MASASLAWSPGFLASLVGSVCSSVSFFGLLTLAGSGWGSGGTWWLLSVPCVVHCLHAAPSSFAATCCALPFTALVGPRACKKNELLQLATHVSEVGSALPMEHVARMSDASVRRLVRSGPVHIELQIDA